MQSAVVWIRRYARTTYSERDNSETRGRSADVFSSGCFFLEILRIYVHLDFDAFQEVRRSFGESGHLTILFSTVEEVPGANGSYMNKVRPTTIAGPLLDQANDLEHIGR
ncbi:hypothetical protein V2W45_240751 [Cenococcum geophilum]